MLSPESLKRIDHEIAKYPPERKASAVMAALAVAQDEKGWLSTEVMDFVADYLGMPPIAVYEIATFYEMFNTRPTGKYKLTLCTNLPCALQDAAQAAVHLKEKLGIDFNETTADGMFTLEPAMCLAACDHAPMMQIDLDYFEDLSEEKLDHILGDIRAGRTKIDPAAVVRSGA